MKISEIEHPTGTYACLVPNNDSKAALEQLQKDFDIPNAVSASSMHMTVIYSRKPCPAALELIGSFKPIYGKIVGFKYLPTQNGTRCVVAELDCNDAVDLHNHIRETYGASHDYPSYIAHITLSYDCAKDVEPIIQPIPVVFDTLKISALDTNWQDKK
jgi:hypothetical protein